MENDDIFTFTSIARSFLLSDFSLSILLSLPLLSGYLVGFSMVFEHTEQ